MTSILHDAHMHLDFFRDPLAIAREAQKRGISLLACSVLPQGYLRMRAALGTEAPLVNLALGIHPWWAAEASLDEFDECFSRTRWIGEVGLDYSPKRPDHERQAHVFEHVLRRCASVGNKVLSIHSVRAAGPVVRMLEESGCLRDNVCIFHWFSGSTDDLWRAIRAGCWFSVNERQAATRRAKEQLKLIPKDRLLLETDLPPQDDPGTTVDDIVRSLATTRQSVERIWGQDIGDTIARNWSSLTSS